MKQELLDLLVCLRCRGRLRHEPTRTDGREIVDGTIHCMACGATFPVRDGVPRMVPDGLSSRERATARAFGQEWKTLSELSAVSHDEFASYIEPLSPADLRGLTVLDAGCGMGKFSFAAAAAGARAVIAVDLSEAVDVAYSHLRTLPNAHVVQASIYDLPLRPETFDFVFSIGVLHHLPDPERGFRDLVPLAAPGGRILVWLYALEGNETFVRVLDPFRVHLFSRLPAWVNRLVATLLAAPLWLIIRVCYLPLARRGLAERLPYGPYFVYFSRLGFRTFWGTVYDKLVPPISFYLSGPTIRRWLNSAGLVEVGLRHRNRNSWTCLARKNAA